VGKLSEALERVMALVKGGREKLERERGGEKKKARTTQETSSGKWERRKKKPRVVEGHCWSETETKNKRRGTRGGRVKNREKKRIKKRGKMTRKKEESQDGSTGVARMKEKGIARRNVRRKRGEG